MSKVNGMIVHRGKELPDKDTLWELISAAAGPAVGLAADSKPEGEDDDGSKP